MDFRCQESTFNLQNNNSYVKEKFFVYHVTRSTYSRIIFQAMYISRIYIYRKDICKNLKGIGKIQFISELKILLNLSISKFHGDLHKEKKTDLIKSLNSTPYLGKLTLV